MSEEDRPNLHGLELAAPWLTLMRDYVNPSQARELERDLQVIIDLISAGKTDETKAVAWTQEQTREWINKKAREL